MSLSSKIDDGLTPVQANGGMLMARIPGKESGFMGMERVLGWLFDDVQLHEGSTESGWTDLSMADTINT